MSYFDDVIEPRIIRGTYYTTERKQMAYETKELSFSAFKNKRKEKDSHPDFTGEAKVNGQIYWVSVWEKRDKNNNPYFSGALKLKDFTPAKEAARGVDGPDEGDNPCPW